MALSSSGLLFGVPSRGLWMFRLCALSCRWRNSLMRIETAKINTRGQCLQTNLPLDLTMLNKQLVCKHLLHTISNAIVLLVCLGSQQFVEVSFPHSQPGQKLDGTTHGSFLDVHSKEHIWIRWGSKPPVSQMAGPPSQPLPPPQVDGATCATNAV